LNSRIGVSLISTLLVLWLCIPLSVWIKPNGNVAPINESAIIGRPVGCTISFRSRFIHFEIIGLNKPYRLGLCNKAVCTTKPFENNSKKNYIKSVRGEGYIFC